MRKRKELAERMTNPPTKISPDALKQAKAMIDGQSIELCKQKAASLGSFYSWVS